ncbi:MAG: class I SAM-dependent methyltransferase [Acidimicrobiia bacterium]|nr:class I SAM-dependent methyltransferase [Acidimicrobiia bacterium]
MNAPTPDPSGLRRYAHLLFEANKATNLVSRRLSESEVEDLVYAHAELLERVGHPGADSSRGLDGCRLLDVGSGGGLPGLPLKLRHPELHVVLAEARKLRVACLEEFVKALNLEDIDVFAGDVSSWQRRLDEDSRFDIVTAFGVGRALDAIGLVAPLMRRMGTAYLSIPASPEAADIATWHLEAASWERGADVLARVLEGGRSVLRLRPLVDVP